MILVEKILYFIVDITIMFVHVCLIFWFKVLLPLLQNIFIYLFEIFVNFNDVYWVIYSIVFFVVIILFLGSIINKITALLTVASTLLYITESVNKLSIFFFFQFSSFEYPLTSLNDIVYFFKLDFWLFIVSLFNFSLFYYWYALCIDNWLHYEKNLQISNVRQPFTLCKDVESNKPVILWYERLYLDFVDTDNILISFFSNIMRFFFTFHGVAVSLALFNSLIYAGILLFIESAVFLFYILIKILIFRFLLLDSVKFFFFLKKSAFFFSIRLRYLFLSNFDIHYCYTCRFEQPASIKRLG